MGSPALNQGFFASPGVSAPRNTNVATFNPTAATPTAPNRVNPVFADPTGLNPSSTLSQDTALSTLNTATPRGPTVFASPSTNNFGGSLGPLGGSALNRAAAVQNATPGNMTGVAPSVPRPTPATTTPTNTSPAPGSIGPYNSAQPPSFPTLAPANLVNTGVYGTSLTSQRPTLDSYLASSIQGYYNPALSGSPTSPGDARNNLQQMAQSYLQLYPDTGSAADIPGLVDKYSNQYSSWLGQQTDFANNNPSYNSPFSASGQQQQAQGASQPASTFTPPATNTTTQQPSNSSFWQQLLANRTPQAQTYQPVKTPLGYTQYQGSIPQGNSQDVFTQLILSMLLGQNNNSGNQGSFWDLLR